MHTLLRCIAWYNRPPSLSSSSSSNKKEWCSQDATSLITLISAKKKSKQKFHQDPTNPATIATARRARTNSPYHFNKH